MWEKNRRSYPLLPELWRPQSTSIAYRLMLPASHEWDRVGTVFVLRSCLVTPFLERETTFDVYWEDFRFSIEKTLSQF